jgi:CubicO group peptidase (beta-lactamase class C family)
MTRCFIGRRRVVAMASQLFWGIVMGVVRLCLMLVFVSGWAGAAIAQPSDAQIASGADKILGGLATPEGPGAVVLIARGDKVIYRGVRGMANMELGVPLKADQTFRIASITKMFTAATILKLEAAGKLRLDDKLSAYFPEVPNAQIISLRQLLSHTAGVSEKPKQPIAFAFRRHLTTAQQVGEIAQRDPAFAPGTRFSYSNSGFILLGAVIEKVTGKPWYEVVGDELLTPLQLRRTHFADTAAIVPGRATGYTTVRATGGFANAGFIDMTVPAAAGALESTPDDLLRFIRALVTGQAVGSVGFMTMTTPPTNLADPGPPNLAYGLGTYVWTLRGAKMVGHTGQIDGFASVAAYIPEADVTIVALGNNDEFDAQMTARRLAGIVLGKPYPEPQAVTASPETLAALVGEYQYDPTTLQRLVLRDGKLYSVRGTRDPLKLQLTAQGRLHFDPDLLSYFEPVRDSKGEVTGLNYFAQGEGPPRFMPRVQKP